MLFGADVTHPAPGSGARSVAAVVGSLDCAAARYATQLAVQPGGVEHIATLQSMADALLRGFYASTRQRPSRLIFYRDGVGEGQFQSVLATELPLLRAACAALGDGSYAPRITFIVVQKRHSTRLFVANERDADRSGNVPPGTVVDRTICHPSEHDFYLTSHAGIQGTTRPAHYHVLVDENGYGADALQTLSYNLCHLYCRCTRSVSIVPPVYYAHLAAYRGRMLLAAQDAGSDAASSEASGGGGEGATGVPMAMHPRVQNAMFFV